MAQAPSPFLNASAKQGVVFLSFLRPCIMRGPSAPCSRPLALGSLIACSQEEL